MAESGIVTVNKRQIVVKELRVVDVRSYLKTVFDGKLNDWDDLLTKIDEMLSKATDLTMAEIDEMTPSELEKVIEKFREVNGPLLRAAAAAKRTAKAAIENGSAIKELLPKALIDEFVGSLKGGTATQSSTDGVSS